jgi:AraC-like DNA-binding protein/mannose-6-phosphate isomerase-like protein (cupin superfamily)
MKAQFEALWAEESQSFIISVQEKAAFDAPFHYHPEYELTYILSSAGVRYTGNHIENFRENDFILLGPGLPHCWKNSVKRGTMASAIVIQWKEDFLGKGWMDCKEFGAIKKMLDLSVKGIRFRPEIAMAIKPRLSDLSRLSSFDTLIGFLEILQRLAVSRYELLCREDFSGNFSYSDNARINLTCQFVKTNFSKRVTLADVSKRVHMKEQSFSRFFSKTMRKTFFYYLNEYRINHSCKLLIETDKDIGQIAFASGFESLPFFFRQFKRFKRCTPQRYRMQFAVQA